jgi:hypothetical protein
MIALTDEEFGAFVADILSGSLRDDVMCGGCYEWLDKRHAYFRGHEVRCRTCLISN